MGEEMENSNMVEKMEKLTETLRVELQESKQGSRSIDLVKISNMERIISDLQKTAQSLKAHVEEENHNNNNNYDTWCDVIEANKQYEYLRQYRNLPEIWQRNGIHYCLYSSKDCFAFILEATKRCRADHGDGENNMLFRSIDENIFTLLVEEYLNFHKNNQMNDFLKETTKEDFGATVDPYVFGLQEYLMLVCKPPPDWQPFNKASMKNINQIVRQALEDIQNHDGILPTEETDIQQSILLNKNRIHTHIKKNFPIQLWSLAD
ncbi:hypothetical protein Dsin_022037 [Dipteronia sinensis]|uniref:Uncharacterized protein n=1 Tax=Dipteronia sinensis TaxID=43782 RepID=A0AAE0A1Q9_9ROSI|nr:hypothetical protein Dsin_022037 [Dipteronia sinensis]